MSMNYEIYCNPGFDYPIESECVTGTLDTARTAALALAKRIGAPAFVYVRGRHEYTATTNDLFLNVASGSNLRTRGSFYTV